MILWRGDNLRIPDNVLKKGTNTGYFRGLKIDKIHLRCSHLANFDILIIKAPADHFDNLEYLRLANQRSKAEIEYCCYKRQVECDF